MSDMAASTKEAMTMPNKHTITKHLASLHSIQSWLDSQTLASRPSSTQGYQQDSALRFQLGVSQSLHTSLSPSTMSLHERLSCSSRTSLVHSISTTSSCRITLQPKVSQTGQQCMRRARDVPSTWAQWAADARHLCTFILCSNLCNCTKQDLWC